MILRTAQEGAFLNVPSKGNTASFPSRMEAHPCFFGWVQNDEVYMGVTLHLKTWAAALHCWSFMGTKTQSHLVLTAWSLR